MSVRPAPPPPCKSRKPGKVIVYRAMYDYEAQADDELSFSEGDLLYINDAKPGQSWLTASCGDASGLVPFNYVNEQAEPLVNPLHEAARRGNIEWLRELIGHQLSVNGQDHSGNTPLHWAARGGHTDCVQLLLSTEGVCLNVQNTMGETSLHLASYHGHEEVVSALLRAGIDSTLTNNDQKTAHNLARSASCMALLAPRRQVNTAEQELYGVDNSDSD